MTIKSLTTLLIFSVFGVGTHTFFFNHHNDNLEFLKNPFTGLVEARDAIRKLKEEQKLPDTDIVVYIKGGVYPLEETIQFTSEDAGTEKAKIIYRPYKNQEVRFSGAKTVTDFEPLHNENALSRIAPKYHDKIVQVNLKAQGIKSFGEIKATGFGRKSQPAGLELFFNGQPMTLARYPNQGWMRIDSVPQTGSLVERGLERIKRYGIPIGRHYGRFTYKENEPNKWLNEKDIWLHGYWTHDWADSYVRIDSIDTLKHEFMLAEPHGVYGYTKNQKYYAFNILEELDSPGEWYLDRKEGMLYFWPPSPLTEGTAYVSLLKDAMITMKDVSYMQIENFIFEGARGDGIMVKGGKDNIIAGCTIRNIGSRGVIVEGGSKHGLISSNIYNIGDEGIIISGGDRKTLSSADHYAINNEINNYSRINRTHRAAIKLSGVGHHISHNRIHDAPHTGVIFDGNDHVLEFNEIYNIAQETGDVGAFYTGRDWSKRGNIIRYNYFHHLHGPGAHGVNAVYLDDAASGTTIYGNVFHDVDRGVLIGGGHDNIVKNNIFIKCKDAIYIDNRGLTWAKNYIAKGGGWQMYKKLEAINYREPPYSTRYPELSSILEKGNPAVPMGNIVQSNVCYGNWLRTQGEIDNINVSVTDNFIVNRIPKYINVGKGKIYPKNKSKMKKINFKKIPFSKIGPNKDKSHKSLLNQ